MNTPKDEKASQRGATLTGYALTLALMIAVALGSVSLLERSSEDFLTESGTTIGSPRPSSQDAANNQLTGLSTSGNSLGPG